MGCSRFLAARDFAQGVQPRVNAGLVARLLWNFFSLATAASRTRIDPQDVHVVDRVGHVLVDADDVLARAVALRW